MREISERDLTDAFKRGIDKIGEAVDRFPYENEESYRMWLAQTYYLVRHTTRLLTLSAARVPIEQRDVHYSLIEHLRQEENHDLFLVKDLKKLGSEPMKYPELPETRLVRNNQYYWITFGSHHALLGYSLLLEGLAATRIPDVLRRLEAGDLGHAASFLRLHGEVDLEHYQHGLEHLKDCPHGERPALLANLEETLLVYTGMYDRVAELTKSSGGFKKLRAA